MIESEKTRIIASMSKVELAMYEAIGGRVPRVSDRSETAWQQAVRLGAWSERWKAKRKGVAA